MKLAWSVCLLCCLAFSAAGQSPLARLQRVWVYGTEYVRLEDWARANGFQLSWSKRDDEVRLTRGATVLTFSHNSRRCTVNGVAVWLSVPVTMKAGSAYVAPLDFSSALHPILFPQRSAGSRKIRTIVLDPGHGGKDPGQLDGRQQEKKYTLLVAQELSVVLTKAGFRVSLTRNSDTFLELPTRADIARRRGADLFLSLHFNAADRSVSGAETYCLTPPRASSTNAGGEGAGTGSQPGNRNDGKNVLLAWQVQKALASKLGAEDRGVRRARFAVLRDATMPALLIEAGFMTHPVESRRIYDPVYRKRMAQAIADGVLAYRRLVETP